MEIGMICDACKNARDHLIDGWLPSCDAFPEGIPTYYAKIGFDQGDKYRICNNGIGYEAEVKNGERI